MQGKMSATAEHLVEFYGYKIQTVEMFNQSHKGLTTKFDEIVMYDSNLESPFQDILFLGYESEDSFQITSVMI